MTASRRRQHGFTLLEVIVAFALLALALSLLLGSLSGASRQVRDSADSSRATLHAQSLLAQLGAGGVHDLTGRVLLADEPCSAMDASHTLRAMEHLRALAGRGLAVGVVLHDLSLVARFADEAALLGDDGTIALRDEAGAVLSSPVLGRVFGARFTLLSAPGLPPVPMAVNGADAAKSPRA